MNCQEVMEYMQRELDHDLNAQEKEIMWTHLEQCSECSAMFERLQLLSEELTKLPKVVPSHSLVDAILPKLNDMDEQAATSRRESTVPIPFGSAQPTLRPPQDLPRAPRFGKHISWRLAGGVVAAGLAIGFFIYGGDADRSVSDNADEWLKPQQQSESKAIKQESPAAGTTEKAPNTDQSIALNSSSPKSDEPGKNAPQQTPKSAAAPAEPSAKPANRSADPGTGNKPAESTVPKPSSVPTGSKESDTETKETPTPGPTQNPSHAAAASPSTTPAPTVPPTGDDAPKSKSAEPQPTAKSFEPPKDNLADKYAITRDQENPDSTFTLMSVSSKDSEDGEFTAVVEEQRVLIRMKDTQEVVVASKRTWGETDIISLTGWNKDNQLTYQVTSGNQTHTYVLDPAAKTETIYSP